MWWYKFRFAGQMIRESSKSESETIAKEAERARRRELEGSWNGIVRKRTLPPPLDHAGTAWLEAKKPHIATRTYEIYDVALRCHLKPAMGTLLLCDIDGGQIASYQAKRKSEGADARTLNKELQVLRQILKKHKLWANLQGDVKFERESDHIGKAMTEEQEAALLAACESNLLLSTIVSLALNSALRRNEIRTLRWQQIDLLGAYLNRGTHENRRELWASYPAEQRRLRCGYPLGQPVPRSEARTLRVPSVRGRRNRAEASQRKAHRPESS